MTFVQWLLAETGIFSSLQKPESVALIREKEESWENKKALGSAVAKEEAAGGCTEAWRTENKAAELISEQELPPPSDKPL